MFFWFGTVFSVDWRHGFFPLANNVMAILNSCTPSHLRHNASMDIWHILQINNDRGRLCFVSMCVFVRTCISACSCVLYCGLCKNPTWPCLNRLGLIHFNILPPCQARRSKHNATGETLFGNENQLQKR